MIAAPLLALALGLAAPSSPNASCDLCTDLRETVSAVRWMLGNHVVSRALEAIGRSRGSFFLRADDEEASAGSSRAGNDEEDKDEADTGEAEQRAEEGRAKADAAREGSVRIDADDHTISIDKNGITVTPAKKGAGRGFRIAGPNAPPVAPLAPIPPAAPIPPLAPIAPIAPVHGRTVSLRPLTLHVTNAPAVEVLHRIAQSVGWTLTVAGLGEDRVSLDVTEVDPRDAVRQVLKASRAWAVLRNDKLVVVPTGEGGLRAGELVERRERTGSKSSSRKQKQDQVHVMQGDITVPRGTVVGDTVVVGDSLTVEPGALVQGDAFVVGGNINVEQGGMVMGDAVALLGLLDVEPGGQILGEHVQVGSGKIFKPSKRSSWFGGAGLFGFFPTLALFALVYLVGLLCLFAAPDRLRGIGATLLANPVRSFTVGFLSWLLALPIVVLLCVTLVGIPLVPLVPLALFLAFALGLAAVALRIGEQLPAGPGQKFVPTAALGMGMAVVALTSFVPLIGFALVILVQFAAVGAVVASKVGRPLPGSAVSSEPVASV